jgi:hypothetical protein
MSILVGIDGTGEDISPGHDRDDRYDVTFANSFVRRLCDRSAQNNRYIRGPVALGGGLMNAISEGHNFILARRQAGVNEPILLTGYSRGAAGAVVLATRLQSHNLEVKAMLLFDCVDRHIGIDATFIPKNVRHVLHVTRAPESGSRASFGNAGRQYDPSTEYSEAIFHCTHGAMGGMPYHVPAGASANDLIVEGFPDGVTNTTYAQDALGSDRVWYYVQPFISKQGFQ